MDMTTFWLFIGCSIFLIIGIIGAGYHYRRVKSWDKCPSSSEYMQCLFIGWCSWMLIAISGCCILFVLPVLIADVIRIIF